jgi:cytoskeletal protein CcmA (bactofilin family)
MLYCYDPQGRRVAASRPSLHGLYQPPQHMRELSVMKTSDNARGYVGNGIQVTGDINFSGQLFVDGSVEGNLTTETGTLIIGKDGKVRAKVVAQRCVVQGTLIGDLIATGSVEISETGCVKGTVAAPALTLAEGAIVDGQISMGQQAGSAPIGKVRPTIVPSAADKARAA